MQDFRHNLNKFSFQVIKTIPFNQLNIEVLSVEFNLLGRLEISAKKGKKKCAAGFFLALVLSFILTFIKLATLTSEPLEVTKMRLAHFK